MSITHWTTVGRRGVRQDYAASGLAEGGAQLVMELLVPFPSRALSRSCQEICHHPHLFPLSFLSPLLPFSLPTSTNILDVPRLSLPCPRARVASFPSINRTLSMVSETWHLNACWISEEILQPWPAAEHSSSLSVLPRLPLVRKILCLQGKGRGICRQEVIPDMPCTRLNKRDCWGGVITWYFVPERWQNFSCKVLETWWS